MWIPYMLCTVLMGQKNQNQNYHFRKNPHHIGLILHILSLCFGPPKNCKLLFNNVPFIIQQAFYSEAVSDGDSFRPFSGISLFQSVFKCIFSLLLRCDSCEENKSSEVPKFQILWPSDREACHPFNLFSHFLEA